VPLHKSKVQRPAPFFFFVSSSLTSSLELAISTRPSHDLSQSLVVALPLVEAAEKAAFMEIAPVLIMSQVRKSVSRKIASHDKASSKADTKQGEL
jgi:hypothetical protein